MGVGRDKKKWRKIGQKDLQNIIKIRIIKQYLCGVYPTIKKKKREVLSRKRKKVDRLIKCDEKKREDIYTYIYNIYIFLLPIRSYT